MKKSYLLRLEAEDYEDVKHAASALGLGVPSFMRAILILRTREILEHFEVKRISPHPCPPRWQLPKRKKPKKNS